MEGIIFLSISGEMSSGPGGLDGFIFLTDLLCLICSQKIEDQVFEEVIRVLNYPQLVRYLQNVC